MIIPIRAIPKYSGAETTHSDMADNKDIRNAIFGAVPEANKQVKDFAKYFGRNNQRESCKAIFDFLKTKIKYVADGDLQLIKLPSALIHSKVGDCKSYSLLTSAILTNLGIPHHFVLVSYNNDPTPSHIYVETDDGCIIDAVWGIFDSEKTPTYKYKVKPNGKMKVKSIKGIDGNCSTYMGACNCGCGCPSCAMTGIAGKAERQQRRAERQERRQERKAERKENSGSTGAAIAFAAGRNLFLVAVKANLDGLASKLQKMDFANVSKYWKSAGGNAQNLQTAINKGASKPSKKLGLLGLLKKKSQKKVNGIGAATIDTNLLEEALIPVATAVGTAIQPATGTAAGASLGAVLKKLIPILIPILTYLGTSDDASDINSNLGLTQADLSSVTTGVEKEYTNEADFIAETDKFFDPKNIFAMTDEELLDIYKGLSIEAKGWWKKLQTKYGRPKKDNTTTYIIIGAAALAGYFLFIKKKA